jgi:hypothetical protein
MNPLLNQKFLNPKLNRNHVLTVVIRPQETPPQFLTLISEELQILRLLPVLPFFPLAA